MNKSNKQIAQELDAIYRIMRNSILNSTEKDYTWIKSFCAAMICELAEEIEVNPNRMALEIFNAILEKES